MSERIQITPEHALIDEEISISLSGFNPASSVTLRLTCVDGNNTLWESYATYQTNMRGGLTVARAEATDGTYTGVDAMGLFWSMEPREYRGNHTRFLKEVSNGFVLNDVTKHIAYTLTAEVAGDVVDTAEFTRTFMAEDVLRISVEKADIKGVLFQKKTKGKRNRSGIIVIGGSDGGIHEREPALLASHGYTVLSLAYFRYQGLPENLIEIPLEYFEKAFTWMRRRTNGDITLMGRSRGAELALLFGTYFPKVTSIIANMPTCFLNAGFASLTGKMPSSWSYKGVPLPFLPISIGVQDVLRVVQSRVFGTPFIIRDVVDRAMENKEALEKACISVEKIKCPFMVISGKDDKVLPSHESGEWIAERLATRKSGTKYTHLSYDDAGHIITAPYMPTVFNTIGWHRVFKVISENGGTREGLAHADKDSWDRILAFLGKTIGTPDEMKNMKTPTKKANAKKTTKKTTRKAATKKRVSRKGTSNNSR